VIGRSRADLPILLPGYPPSGVSYTPGERASLRKAAGIAEDEFLLLNAARLAPEKAQDQLLKSFRLIRDKHPKARLWISGVGLPDIEQNLRRMIVELKLEGAAELVGFKEDYHSTLKLADVLVHPSHVDGMPLALLGAMEAGLPIVASSIGGIPEIVEHGETGFLVRENDWKGFAEAVNAVLGDSERRRRMGVAAQERVKTVLSIDTAVRKLEQVYHRMMPVRISGGA
jgi:glycosyltransferase involved in cell wall biosynthesis